MAHRSAGPRAELLPFERTFPRNLEPVPDVAGQFGSNRATFCSVAKFPIGAGFASRVLRNFININDILGATQEISGAVNGGLTPFAPA